MAIANPRIHIICGICGSKDFFSFKVQQEIHDDTNRKYQNVTLCCDNCSSLTDLDELIKDESVNP